MNPPVPFAPELQVALDAAADAASLIVERRGADDVRYKGPSDLVTAVDMAAEQRIVDRIRAEFPDDALIAEEGHRERGATGRRWFIDPVDGTTNFVHGHPYVCVSVGFADEQGLAVGVVHAPLLGEVFHAVRGGGAYVNGRPIRVSTAPDRSQALLGTGFPFKAGKGDPEAFLRLVGDAIRGSHGLRRAGSAALDLAYVACGRLDAYFEIGLGPWDAAAGLLLVAEAGGTATGWPGDADPPVVTGKVIATNGLLHPWLESLIAEHAHAIVVTPRPDLAAPNPEAA